MTCAEFKSRHPAQGETERAHLASCGSCRDYVRTWELLKEYPPVQPGAQFYWAVRRKLAPRILRFAAVVSAAAAALLVAVVLRHSPIPIAIPKAEIPSSEEREIVENWDLLQNYELLRTLELVGDTRSPLAEDKK
jgi:hypothetical protein